MQSNSEYGRRSRKFVRGLIYNPNERMTLHSTAL